MPDHPTASAARVSRRRALGAGTALAAAGLAWNAAPAMASARPAHSAEPATAWRRLMAGNDRFVNGQQQHPRQQIEWRTRLAHAQQPFACVLGCADSRVTPELVFDHGLGDLFTVRTAGHVLDDSVIGSIEYAVEHLGTRLVVVLGHERCGAVSAAVDLVRDGSTMIGPVSALVRSVEAAVLSTPAGDDHDAFLAACVRNHARRVAAQLRERSAVIRAATQDDTVGVVAAVYDLDEFRVTPC